jgi:HK97 family phage major capsid protein
MKIKLLSAVGEHAKGATITVEKSVGEKYVAAGLAEAVADEAAGTLSAVAEAIKDAVAKGFAAGRAEADAATAANPLNQKGLHQGEYTSADAELKGLAVFGTKGGFLHAVRDIATGNPTPDTARKVNDWREMQVKAGLNPETKGAGSPSGMHEASDSDGGVLVLPEFSQQIYQRSMAEENFLAEARNLVVRGNTLSLPGLDDASRADGSRQGGITGYWANEAENYATATRPKFRTMDLKLKKLYVLAYMTDELLADSPYALEQHVTVGAGKEIAFKVNDAMVSGGGAGTPLGIAKGGAVIAVAKETGQAAATILIQNVEKMWMRLNARYRKDAVWLINQDCEQALQMMAFPVGIGGVPIYQPQGGVSSPRTPPSRAGRSRPSSSARPWARRATSS